MDDQYQTSRLYSEWAQRSVVGGVNSVIRSLEKPTPLFFEEGHGAWLTDVDGNEYVDYIIGQGALLLGHAQPDIVAAITAQASRGTHWAAQSRLEFEVAEITGHELNQDANDFGSWNRVSRLRLQLSGQNKH